MPVMAWAGQPLFYAAYGDAAAGRPPVVLVHGAGGTHLHWPPQVRRLAGARVLALDLPGHGQSAAADAATQAASSIEVKASAVLAVLDALGIARAVVVGHSMGGAIALALALARPERVAGLGLVGTGARLRVAPEILDGLTRDFAGTVAAIVERMFGPQAPERLKALALKRMLEVDARVLRADWDACNAFDVRERLGEIAAPCLVVTGSADVMTPEKYARFLAESLPAARLHVEAGAGHMVMLERPEAVAQVLGEWVRGVDPRE